ncbi:hypothetical protein PHMEG_00017083 [Phytophthora megakarya]|uniref:Uncharacterized protein n=1 Tax=Phytophthora megakarya TaxID=4795 RepID=A0A225VY95_9STRA|nr:hypothetical protein PHMEG_00017083 [Phytophthora megakarya]
MAFQARWRELTKQDWKANKSTGLSVDYTFVMPGKKTKEGVRGQEYFVGEEELMRHLDRIDLGMYWLFGCFGGVSDVCGVQWSSLRRISRLIKVEGLQTMGARNKLHVVTTRMRNLVAT